MQNYNHKKIIELNLPHTVHDKATNINYRCLYHHLCKKHSNKINTIQTNNPNQSNLYLIEIDMCTNLNTTKYIAYTVCNVESLLEMLKVIKFGTKLNAKLKFYRADINSKQKMDNLFRTNEKKRKSIYFLSNSNTQIFFGNKTHSSNYIFYTTSTELTIVDKEYYDKNMTDNMIEEVTDISHDEEDQNNLTLTKSKYVATDNKFNNIFYCPYCIIETKNCTNY